MKKNIPLLIIFLIILFLFSTKKAILESQKQKLENKGKYMHKESEKLMMKLKNNVII